jgi:hypothetical protein
MKKYVLIFLPIICAFLLFPAQIFSQENPVPPQDHSFGSLHKSLLLPGWGQLSEKKYLKGIFFLGAEIFCFTSILHNNQQGNKAYLSYKEASNIEDAVHYRSFAEKYDTRRNQFLAAAAAIWVLNLIDIYLIVKNKQKKERNLTFRLESASKKNLSLSISYRF